MADTSTGLPVQTLTGQFIAAKVTDAAGTNVAAVDASGRLSVSLTASSATVAADTELPAAAALADAAAAAPATPTVGSVGLVMNATTLDRQRAVIHAQDTPGTGIAAAGILGEFDDTGTAAVTENQFAPVRISSRRALLVEGVASGTNINVNLAASAATVTVDSELPAAAALADASANPTVPGVGAFLMGFNGTTWDRVDVANTGRLQVDVISGAGGTQYAGDAAATATPTGTMSMALANAAAPSDVSANNDAVALWALRNGSLVVNMAAGGTLLTNIGQAAATAKFVRINDGTTTAGVIAGTTSLKTDVASIIGSVPGATNPLPVRLTDGAAFYAASSGAPVDPKFSTQTSAGLGVGASTTLTHYVTSGKTGQLAGVDVGATVPLKVVINTVVTGTPTGRVVLFTKPYEVYQWRAPFDTYITRASADASSGFSVTITNKDAAVAADVYSTAYWDEV